MAQNFDLVIIGMGSGGLTAARLAAELDLRVAAIERDRIGGDCLWTGCVPSKALLASARVAHHMRTADAYGLDAVEPTIERARVWSRIHEIRNEIARTDDNAATYEGLGIRVIQGEARVRGPQSVEVNGQTLETRYILVATGSRPAIPPIPGLEDSGYLTSETLFELDEPPGSVFIIGGGPIAVELSQALRRLGCEVVIGEVLPRLLSREEPDLADRLTSVLRQEGVRVHADVRIDRVSVERNGQGKTVAGSVNGERRDWHVDDVLIAAGRRPRVDGLGLEGIGVDVEPGGVVTDARARTSVRSIYATGDVAGRYLFTHWAGYESTMAVRDMFFPGRARLTDVVPWCTFTDPELAHCGLTEEQARQKFNDGAVRVFQSELAASDRARADGSTAGLVKLVTTKDRLVGGHVLAPAAGEVIQEVALAIREEIRLDQLADYVHAYPTIATSINLLAAGRAYERARRLKWLIRS